MMNLLLWFLVIRTVLAYGGYDTSDTSESDETYFTYTDHYTHCTQDGSLLIQCNTTLNEHDYKQYVAKFSAPFPRNSSGRIAVKCSECDLETFPNDMLDAEFNWVVLDFSSSHIKVLKMSSVNVTIARSMDRLYFNNNSITSLDDESFPRGATLSELDLSHNLIETITGNRTLSKMRVIKMNLAYNRLTYLDPMLFKDVYLMKSLILSHNMLTEAAFTCQMDSKFEITLSSNPIVNLGVKRYCNDTELPRLFGPFSRNLKAKPNCSFGGQALTLILVESSLKTIDLWNATQLELVNLSSNHLTCLELQNSIHLEVLDVSKNNITNMRTLFLPGGLSDLNLSHNKIANLSEKTFHSLGHLRYLNLAHCGLHTLNPRTYIPYCVKILDLSHNVLVNFDVTQYNGYKELDELHLNGNRLTDINVEDLKQPVHIAISNNDWNCTRLRVIVEVLTAGTGLIFFKPCDKLTCPVSVHGIACDDHVANRTVASGESNETDERFGARETSIWKEVEANLTAQFRDDADDPNLTNIVHKIKHDLRNILKATQGQSAGLDTQNINNINRTIRNRFRDISERIERLRRLTNGFSKDDIIRTGDSGSSNGDSDQSHAVAIVLIVIGMLVFVAAAIYVGLVIQRKRTGQSVNYVANYSEVH